jgi:hypothetical protein
MGLSDYHASEYMKHQIHPHQKCGQCHLGCKDKTMINHNRSKLEEKKMATKEKKRKHLVVAIMPPLGEK